MFKCNSMHDALASNFILPCRPGTVMRTTLNIDDDLLIAVKEVARRSSSSVGAVVSGLLRQSLVRGARNDDEDQVKEPDAEYGFRPFPKRGGVVTNELIDRLREETGE